MIGTAIKDELVRTVVGIADPEIQVTDRCATAGWANIRLVQQIDVIAIGTAVQIMIDARPALAYERVISIRGIALR